GKGAVIEHAVNEGLDTFYRAALLDAKLQPLGRPAADILEWPKEDFTGDLLVAIEVDVRPEIKLPKTDGLAVTVDAIEVSADDIQNELDALRSRFGTLAAVDRPAKSGDFVSIDLVATIDGAVVDNATGISYEVGSGELIDGIDEAVDSLTAGESTSFESVLLGGEHEGKTALISVTVTAVKERELPKADDEFAQMASEFDTLKELKESLKEQAAKRKTAGQANQARDALIEKLLASTDIPVADAVIEDEVHRHLEGEGRLEDTVHRAEVTESSTKAYKTQILFDAIAEVEKVELSEDEISQYLFQSAMQYGMAPQEFIAALSESGQLPAVLSELSRNKVVAKLLAKAKVTDSKGKAVDLSEFTRTADDEAPAAEATDAAEEAPAKKAPAKKPAAKKAD
ncbi:MAG TPA: trigger factor, partial [Microbacteriaceae bacterium]|nr:trigger factor [Microbacteriaceae bacterium]